MWLQMVPVFLLTVRLSAQEALKKTDATLPVAGNQAMHPAAETNSTVFRDIYDWSAMPTVRAKNPEEFRPIGLRYGPQTNDIAFLIFAGRKGVAKIPDEMFLYIPGHPQYNIPKSFRCKQVETTALFSKVAFSIQSSGFTREILADIKHGWGYPSNIDIEMTVTTLVGKDRASMLFSMAPENEATGNEDRAKFRSYSMLGAPKLGLRAFGDGTQLSATLALSSGWSTRWFLLPLQGMEKEIAVTVIDSSGAVVETTKMVTTLKTFRQMEGWTGSLKNLKKDQRYTVKAKINLGPWYRDVTAEVVTLLVPQSP